MEKRLPAPGLARGDNVRFAVTVILVTNLALSLGDAAIKSISGSFVLWQIFVLRSIIAIPVLVLIFRLRFGTVPLMPRRPGWVAARSLMLTFMWITYYAALTHVALGVAAATYYTLPIFITLFAAIFIGDRIGAMGWGAILLGFVGVLLILKPDAQGIDGYVLLPLVSAILYALAMILTRTKCRDEHPLVLSLSLNVSFIGVGLLATLLAFVAAPVDAGQGGFLLGAWSAMGATQWLAMTLLAAATIIGSIGAAVAYQAGPPSTVAAFDFAYVGFAGLWGVLFFGEILDAMTLAGIALIVISGVLAVRR